MLDNLKIALKKQKKLMVIFLLTIFLPLISLSFFGLTSIKNEKFKLEKQMENEHRRAAGFLKTQIRFNIKTLEFVILNLISQQVFSKKDYPAFKRLIANRLGSNPLAGQLFVAYINEEPFFPFIQSIPSKNLLYFSEPLKNSDRELLRRAQDNEFRQEKYQKAIYLYRKVFSRTKDLNHQARMLNNIGRCLIKQNKHVKAIEIYLKICMDYTECWSTSEQPMNITAKMQILYCRQNLKDYKNLLENSLQLYEEILQKPLNLTLDQFNNYTSLIKEIISEVIGKKTADFYKEKYRKEFARLNHQQKKTNEQRQIIKDLEHNIIPDLLRRITQIETSTQKILYEVNTIKKRKFYILAAVIFDKDSMKPSGILGVKIKNEYLVNRILKKIIEDVKLEKDIDIKVSDLSGNFLYGKKNSGKIVGKVSEFFPNNFPPWQIEIFRPGTKGMGTIDIKKSFYFWTILTLILILIFGTVLTLRTMAHEMEILKIKSDFVSTISHEFKTPLTSIKALIERLKEGKVKEPKKMAHYFSVISSDTEKLVRLVSNILDFSRIEEGEKEYNFIKTDISFWLDQQIKNFTKSEINREIKIQTHIPVKIPHLSIDRDALSQVLNNLLDNAVKFSLDKKKIDIYVKTEEKNVIIEVNDQGIGIPKKDLGKIFDKFFQGSNVIKRSIKGTGLGLTLVKHYMEVHGGRISVESQIGQGTSFFLIFPLKEKKE